MPNYYMSDDYKFNYGTMDDGGYSDRLKSRLDSTIKSGEIIGDLTEPAKNTGTPKGKGINLYDGLYHSSNMRRDRLEIYGSNDPLFTTTFRFGIHNPYGAISTAREYLFFTKPDLHLYAVDPNTHRPTSSRNRGLESFFWQDMFEHKDRIIRLLQDGLGLNGVPDHFNHLLQNTVVSNLDIPSLNAPSIETSTNTFGVSLSYRGSSEESDDGPEFSLEFKDDRYLNVYSFFRAYEEYETLKKHGIIKPQRKYTMNKILHDQFAVYKFIVDEDMESIIYWGKYYGVYPTSLPRDAFSNTNFQDGLSFTINFKAAFYEDMRPEILYDFNATSKEMFDNYSKHRIDVYNNAIGRSDGRAAKSAMVFRCVGDKRANQNPNKYYYKLVWKGDDVV